MPSIQPQGKFGEFRLIISPRTSCRHRAFRSDFICKAGDGSRACVRWHLPALGLRNDQTLVRPNKIDEPRRRTYPPRRANRRRDVHNGCQRPGGWACLGVARRRIHRRERRRTGCGCLPPQRLSPSPHFTQLTNSNEKQGQQRPCSGPACRTRRRSSVALRPRSLQRSSPVLEMGMLCGPYEHGT